MQPLDAAFDRFRSIRAEVGNIAGTITTEADTRLKVIDRILTGVLGWDLEQISAEEPAGQGFADYACKVDGRFRLIVEAKRDGAPLGCASRPVGAAFKLSGPAFKEAAAKQGVEQAIGYCGAKNAELACVTNGQEWIVFRGSRLGDGIDTRDGYAFVFPNLVAVEERFDLFFSLLSSAAATRFEYRPYFQEAEGQPVRSSVFHKSVRAPGSSRFVEGGPLAADLDRIMSSFFQRLSGDDDPDLIRECFVETAASRHADDQLARITHEIVDRIQTLETGEGMKLAEVISRVKEMQRHEFVLIVGTKGAGKSTFIDRFFDSVLDASIAKGCTVVRIDLRESQGDLEGCIPWLNTKLRDSLERELFNGAPKFDDLRGMFFDEYVRLSEGPLATLYETKKEDFLIRFGEHIEGLRSSDPGAFITGMVRQIVNSRHMLPIIVFDNADHFDVEFQQRVYQYARSIYETSLCLILLPITDRTSWQLTKHGALQSFEHEALFLPTPPTREIIRKRIEFIEARTTHERVRGGSGYFSSRGIGLNLNDVAAFAKSLQQIFLASPDIARVLGDLANQDVRRTLHLARGVISSPHLRVDDLLKAHLSGTALELPKWKITRAIVRQHHDIYPVGHHDYVQNIYCLNEELPSSPLLGVRLLQLLADVPLKEHEGKLIEVGEVVAYAAGMNVDDRAALLWLDAMLSVGLVLNVDPTVVRISEASQIEISPAGKQHLHWGTSGYEYMESMSTVTPLLSEASFAEVRDAGNYNEATARFLEYLLQEDSMFCSMPEHPAYQSQIRVAATIGGARDELRARARAAGRGRRGRATVGAPRNRTDRVAPAQPPRKRT